MSAKDITRLVERLEAVTFPLKTGIRFGTTGERIFGDSTDVVRCLLQAMREPTESQYDALCATDKMWRELDSQTVWRTYIDALLAD